MTYIGLDLSLQGSELLILSCALGNVGLDENLLVLVVGAVVLRFALSLGFGL